jgi:hypothetical protein
MPTRACSGAIGSSTRNWPTTWREDWAGACGGLWQRWEEGLEHALAAFPTARAAVRSTTWTTYRIYAEAQIVPALGHIPLQALTAAHLNRLYADLA